MFEIKQCRTQSQLFLRSCPRNAFVASVRRLTGPKAFLPPTTEAEQRCLRIFNQNPCLRIPDSIGTATTAPRTFYAPKWLGEILPGVRQKGTIKFSTRRRCSSSTAIPSTDRCSREPATQPSWLTHVLPVLLSSSFLVRQKLVQFRNHKLFCIASPTFPDGQHLPLFILQGLPISFVAFYIS